MENSANVRIEDVTITSSYGMGLLAQICEDVTVERMRILPEEGASYSTANDATHFVNCRGQVTVKDSFFDGMLDDALNIHGLYARIERVDPMGLLVRDMHPGAKGQAIYREGCRVAVMDKQLLIPTKTMVVHKVYSINADVTYLTFEEPTDGILPDMTLEELDGSPEVLFENNTVQHNRARSILLAGKKRTVIRNNLFRSPGASIMFECNGDYWYESGGVDDVSIEENTFEDCGLCTLTWGKAVITGSPRKAFDGEHYFHGTIAIRKNRFLGCHRPLVRLANVTRAIFSENEIDRMVGPNTYTDCKTVEDDTLQ
jgi:parallel beta-helix repeat protein